MIAPVVAIPLIALAAYPELPRYRAEWLLGEANARISELFRGRVARKDVGRIAAEADRYADRARPALADDPRPMLAMGVARLVQRRPQPALDALKEALALGERPEVVINIGRARGLDGDEKAAHRAFVRTGWINPAAVATLPAEIRGAAQDELGVLEEKLRRGELTAPPPMD